jgi:hypothetical protein
VERILRCNQTGWRLRSVTLTLQACCNGFGETAGEQIVQNSMRGQVPIIGDFDWTWRGVRVRKTGAWVPFDGAHLHEIAVWIGYWLAVMVSPRPRSGPIVRFVPDRARPWYLIWPALRLAGGRAAREGEAADVTMHFSDETVSAPIDQTDSQIWNAGAFDLSKSRVARVFEDVFGYPLALDPATGTGPAVEKGEANGVHDGRIVTLPVIPVAGKVYQKLIDARADDGLVEDLRTPTVAARPVCVFVKRRPVERRFSNDNVACPLMSVDSLFSRQEQDQITAFCKALQLDWGGLDILRDRTDGRIYIVDVNRTDMGPPIATPLADKLKATRLLAAALAAAVQDHRLRQP